MAQYALDRAIRGFARFIRGMALQPGGCVMILKAGSGEKGCLMLGGDVAD